MLKSTLLKDLVKEFSPISDSYSFKIELYPIINEVKVQQPIEVCNYTDFMERCRYVHGMRKFLHFEDDNARAEFLSLWYGYKNNFSNLKSWEMMCSAYLADYNPIDNYDRMTHSVTSYEGEEKQSYLGTETNTLTKDGSEKITKNGQEYTEKTGREKVTLEKTGSEKNETTESGNETVTKSGDVERYNLPYENNEWAKDTKEKYNDVTEDTEYTNRKTTDILTFPAARKDITDTEFTNRKDTTGYTDRYDKTTFEDREDTNTKTFEDREDVKSFLGRQDVLDERVHGNAGTTMTSDIIKKELELRNVNITNIIIDNFIHQYCTFIL